MSLISPGTGGAWLPLNGVTDGSNAPAGQVGEYKVTEISSNVTVPISGTPVNIGTISLTAGDWDVEGNIALSYSVGGSVAYAAISTVSTTTPTGTYSGTAQVQTTTSNLVNIIIATGPVRLSLAATTIVYLVGIATAASGTCNGQGTIRARRMR